MVAHVHDEKVSVDQKIILANLGSAVEFAWISAMRQWASS